MEKKAANGDAVAPAAGGVVTLEEVTVVGTPPIKESKLNGATVVELQEPETFVFSREFGGTFTDAAIAKDTEGATEFGVTGPLIEFGVSGARSQGQVVEGGKVVEGRSSPDTFYISFKNGVPTVGKGDPPNDSDVGVGGGKPVIVGGLKYGSENRYSEGAPEGLPRTGDPGPENRRFLTQRSNLGFKDLEDDPSSQGQVVVGFNSADRSVTIVVQPFDADPGNKLSEIRDFLASKGVDNALAFDGSDSAALIKDQQVLIAPGVRKNRTLVSGLGFRIR